MKGMKRERRQGNGKEWSRRMMWGRRGGKGKENGGRESETSRRIREGRSKAQENLEERESVGLIQLKYSKRRPNAALT